MLRSCADTTVYDEANDKLWSVVSSKEEVGTRKEHKLSRGDILKLGRVQVKVKDYRIESSSSELDRCPRPHEDGPVDLKICDESPNEKEDMCRICFGTTSTKENPMVSACKCTGSMKFMHVGCIKSWLNSKLLVGKGPHLVAYFWRAFECEVCKEAYPMRVVHNGIGYDLVEVEKIAQGDFLMLENINREKGITRTLYVVTPGPGKMVYKVGRGHESDIRITDISVSRFHAILKCGKDGFVIEDNGSKFGTLVYEPTPLRLEPEVKKVVQVGRTVIYVTVSPAKSQPVPAQAEAQAAKIPKSARSTKTASPPAHNVVHEGGKASPNNGDGNQMEDIPDEDENLM